MYKKILPFIVKLKKSILRFYVNFLSLQECTICGSPICSEIPICGSCMKKEFSIRLEKRLKSPENYCYYCGIPLVSEIKYCTACKKKAENGGSPNLLFKQIFPLFPYKSSCGELVAEWKNKNCRSIAQMFAKEAAQFIAGTEILTGLPIVPMPPRPKKLKTKGWDQIEDLAFHLEIFHKMKILRILKRLDSLPQKSLSKVERAVNLKGKIRLNTDKPLPESLIILDDVITTGATLNTCAEILMQGGCKNIYGLCLFFD